jgi:FkbM family methyltransferase
MYSQRDEEKYILDYFGNLKGRFLDIGAYDGRTFSNTHQLALQGWSGLCIEPSPSAFHILKGLYQYNSNIQLKQIAVGDKSGRNEFYDSNGDAISSFDTNHVELWKTKGAKNFTKIIVNTLTVKDLFSEIGCDFDFINIDTEGTSLFILQKLPFDKLIKLKMVCVEFDRYIEEIKTILINQRFIKYHQTDENIIMVRYETKL